MFLECPNCKADLSANQSVSPGSTMLEGDILLCGDCAYVSKLTGIKLQPLTLEEFENLSKDEKADLRFAVRAIIGHVRQAQRRKIIVPDWYR